MHLIFINGFLGSGKTTLVNHLLQSMEKVGIIVNDFGDVNIDAQLVSEQPLMIEIENGSIFCSCNSHQFAESLITMSKMDLDYLIIESSGFSNPGSLNSVVQQLKHLKQMDYDSIHKVTIVDPVMFERANNLLPVQRQIEVADVLVINKTDLVTSEQLQSVSQKLLEMNPNAKQIKTTYAQINLNDLLATDFQNEFVSFETSRDVSLSSLTIRLEPKSVDKKDLLEILDTLVDKVYRLKGFVLVDSKIHFVEIASDNIELKEINQKNQDYYLVILYTIKQIGKKEILNLLKNLPLA